MDGLIIFPRIPLRAILVEIDMDISVSEWNHFVDAIVETEDTRIKLSKACDKADRLMDLMHRGKCIEPVWKREREKAKKLSVEYHDRNVKLSIMMRRLDINIK